MIFNRKRTIENDVSLSLNNDGNHDFRVRFLSVDFIRLEKENRLGSWLGLKIGKTNEKFKKKKKSKY